MTRLSLRRALRLALLSLLLLSMQWQGHVHPIEVHGRAMHAAQEATFSAPQVALDCLECALLAGGFNAVAGGGSAAAGYVVPAATGSVGQQVRASGSPAWFHSRAPPIFV